MGMPSPMRQASGSIYTGPHKRASRPSLEELATVTRRPSRMAEHEQYAIMQESSAGLRSEEKQAETRGFPARARGDH